MKERQEVHQKGEGQSLVAPFPELDEGWETSCVFMHPSLSASSYDHMIMLPTLI